MANLQNIPVSEEYTVNYMSSLDFFYVFDYTKCKRKPYCVRKMISCFEPTSFTLGVRALWLPGNAFTGLSNSIGGHPPAQAGSKLGL